MKASSKTKQALTEDLASLRRRIGELEQSEVERKKIEEALRESERRLNALYQESPIPTFTWQKQGDDFFLVDFNRAAVQITDGKAYNFLGKSATEFYQDEPQTLEDMRRCFTEHSVIRRDLIAKHFAPEKSLSVHFAFIPPDLIIVHAEDQTDHRRMEKTLRESEEKYRSLFDNTIDAVLLSAPNGRILAANPKACQIFGRTEEEICRIGREGLVDLTDPRLAAALEERVRTGQFRGELTYVRKNGTLFPGEVSSVIFRDRDGNSRTSMIIRDITESKRAEAKLRQQTDAMEAAIDGMALLNEEGEYIYLNKAHAQIYGYENTGELIGKSWRILYDSDELQRFEHEIMPEFGRKGHWYGEAIGKKKDGSKFPQEISLTAMANGGLICVVRDITEHKREEEALHLSEENFRRSLDDSPLGVRVVTAEGETLYANRAILDIYGYDSIDELRKTPVKNRYTPQSYAEFKIRMEKRKRGNGPSEYEISIVRENGEIRHLQVFRKEIFWDSARQFQTVYQDITDRKQAEEALRERDIQFKKLSSWVPGMIYQFTKRPDGTYFIPFTTEAIKDIFGCSPQDVREDFSPIARVILPEDFNKLVDSIEYSAKHLTVWTCEYRVQIPGKSIQWMLGNSTPEKLADGSIT
jgi:PAS domain S-box-containing protein